LQAKDAEGQTLHLYEASSRVIRAISLRWSIPLDRQHVIGHNEIYSLKKCPGNVVNIHKLIPLAKTNRQLMDNGFAI
jgi:N-acetylmuramoyl-L-alanine amidase